MFEDLRSRRVRRFLYLTASLLLLLVLIARFLLGDGPSQILKEITSNLAASIIIWALGLAFLGAFLSDEIAARGTQVLDADTSHRLHARSLAGTNFWYHFGHIGRWTRENALPRMIAAARADPSTRRISVFLMDPNLDSICLEHADRRNSRRRRDPRPVTLRDVKIEILATIVSLAVAHARVPNLEVRCHLIRFDPPFRLDVSSDRAFLTHEDVTAHAVCFDRGNPYYATAVAWFESNHHSLSAEALDLNRALSTSTPPVHQEVLDCLAALGVDVPELADVEFVASITERVRA